MAPKPSTYARINSGGSDDKNSVSGPSTPSLNSTTKGGGTTIMNVLPTSTHAGTSASTSASSASLPYYNLPQWLVGNEKHHVNKFTLKFPPVSTRTRSSIEQYVRQHSSTFLKESVQISHQLRELQREKQDAQTQVDVAQQRFDVALSTKQIDLQKLRKDKQKLTSKKLHELERQMRQQQSKEYKKVEAKMMEDTKTNFEQTYQEEKDKKKNKKMDDDEENLKEVGEGSSSQTSAESDTVDDNNNNNKSSSSNSVEAPPTKKQKLEDGTANALVEGSGGGTDDDNSRTTAAAATSEEESKISNANEEDSNGESQEQSKVSAELKATQIKISELETKRKNAQSELDRLNERKKEMAWLLKTCITAEMKQKKALLKKIPKKTAAATEES